MEDSVMTVVSTNEGLKCEDCIFRTDKIGTCRMYPETKPASIFRDNTCPEYKKEPRD